MPTAADNTDESRMDLAIRSPNHPRPIHVDVTIADATSIEALSKNAANRDAAAAQVLETRKIKKYPNIKVMPFCVESHGRFGECAVQLARLLAPKDPAERSRAIGELYHSVSAELQRANAEAIISATAKATWSPPCLAPLCARHGSRPLHPALHPGFYCSESLSYAASDGLGVGIHLGACRGHFQVKMSGHDN